ncbi:ATP-binding protein [Anaerorhabdus sp.]|uniref:ATP-binding protein n=1 Tax=Anaerorhabdus sp. TaxID=1872524 RepID=UPI002FC6C88B
MKKWDLDKKTKFKNLPQDVSQYDDIDFDEGDVVDAIYRKTEVEIYQEKALIAALPPACSKARVNRCFRQELLSFAPNQEKQTLQQKIESIELLKTVRVPLPFSLKLATEFHSCLINSYSKRYLSIKTEEESNLSTPFGSKQNSKVVGRSSESTDSCFSLTGFSGCGKSSAIASVLKHYPQCIRHKNEWGEFTQVTYLVTNCYTNGNLSQLFNGIGSALDKALNLDYIYEKLISSKRGIQEKTEIISRLIETFCIGIIILDEIQLMNFSRNRSNSFETLMTLMNETKVAIGVVGTQEAREKMFNVLRTARRFQTDIRADLYCSDILYFTTIIKSLWHYQWYNESIPLTSEIVLALCEETNCIIVQLINLLIAMNKDYLLAKKKPIVDAAFVHKTMNKHFAGIKPLLKESVKITDDKINHFLSNNQLLFSNSINDISDQIDSINELQQENIKELDEQRLLRSKVIQNLKNATLASESEIAYAFDTVYESTRKSDRKERILTRVVNKYLLGFDLAIDQKNKISSKALDDFIGLE